MKRSLKSIALQLSDSDVQELLRLRKTEGKKVVALQKKRDKLTADLAKVEQQIARLTGEAVFETAKPKRGRKPAAEKAGTKVGAKTVGRKRRGKRMNISAAVREVFAKMDEPLRASQVVDALPDVGLPVKDVQAMRKRISVVLASQKNRFEQVDRGVYRLRD